MSRERLYLKFGLSLSLSDFLAPTCKFGVASRQLLTNVFLELGIDKAGLFMKVITLEARTVHFIPFPSLLHYLLLFNRSSQNDAVYTFSSY